MLGNTRLRLLSTQKKSLDSHANMSTKLRDDIEIFKPLVHLIKIMSIVCCRPPISSIKVRNVASDTASGTTALIRGCKMRVGTEGKEKGFFEENKLFAKNPCTFRLYFNRKNCTRESIISPY